MTIVNFYRDFGIKNVSNYSTPQIGYIRDFPIPKNVAYYYIGSFTESVPSEKNWYVDNVNKVVKIFAPDKLSKVEGKASKNLKLKSVLKPFIRQTEKYHFVFNISKLDTVPLNTPIVFSYAHLKLLYRRSNTISKDFDTLASTVGSLCMDLAKGMTTRNNFIDIRLPSEIEGMSDSMNLLKKGKNYYIKYFKSFESFILFELLKFMMYDQRETSVFKPLMDVENKKNTYFIFRTTERYTLLSLHDLLAMDNENLESKLNKNGKESVKVFIKYMLSIILNSKEEISDSELEAKLLSLKEKVVIPKVSKKIIKSHTDAKEDAIEEINANVSKGILDKSKADKLKEVVNNSKKVIKRDKKDYVLEDDEINLASSPIADKDSLKDPIGARDRKYFKKYYEEDTKRVFEHLNVSGIVAVSSHDITETNSKINSITTHTLEVMQSNGRTKKLIRHVPKIDDDGKMRLNNNEYILIKQKTDRPIRKINNTTVGLSSFFGKLMVRRGHYSKNNISKGLYKQLQKQVELGNIKLLVEGNNTFRDVVLPYWYTRTANTVLSFMLGDMFLTFNYNTRGKYVKDLESVEKHGTFIGMKGKTPIVIKEDTLYLVKDKPEIIGGFLEVIGIGMELLPLEQTTIDIRGNKIPLILPLLSYIDFITLLQHLAISYTEHASVRESVVEAGEYVIEFKDKVFKFSRMDVEATLLLSGLHAIRKELKFYTVEEVSTVSGFSELYSMLGYNKSSLNELSLLKNLFIDPLTADTLKLMGEPTNFPKLLLRANELLVLDDYKAVNNIEGTMLKSYERINGMLYHSLIKELRVYKNSLGITNSSLVSDPYAVMRMMNEDGSRELLEDMNPIASLKQKENVTLLGFLGRNKDAIALPVKEMHRSEVGFISEASKESAAVGITAYMSSSPNITDMSGLNKSPEKITPYNTASTSTNLSPFGETDDGKRKLFNSVQSGHMIALDNQSVMPILTGYEAVLGQRVDNKFVRVAEDKGVITNLTPSKITISYKTLGKKSYVIKDWFSKETAGESFRHIMKSLPSKGDKVEKGDTLIYDSLFFGPNVFDKKKVLYKTGMLTRVALYEDVSTYEDSAGISKRFSKDASSKVMKIRSITLDSDNALISSKEIGEEVEYTTPLLINRNLGDLKDTPPEMKGKTLDILKDLVSDIPKAEVDGIIKDIVVFYRKDLKEFKGKLRKFIEDSDARLQERYGYTGQVDHTYSINGEPLEIEEIEVKYYIEYSLDMVYRDKGVLQNQLKFTIGDVYDSILTEDGKEVDLTMSPTALGARVVDSAYRAITTTTVMMGITDRVVEMWEA